MIPDLVRTIVLALVQGLTEFLPVSSSAHLILPAELGAWPDQGLAFDVAVHLGTLLAVLTYFRLQLWQLSCGVVSAVRDKNVNSDAHLALMLLLASLPITIVGFLLKDFIDLHLRSSLVIACTTIIFAGALWAADKYSKKNSGFSQLGYKQALIIGFAQMLALVPGTSRSGITITAALFCHQDRVTASRFSFLLSIPAISGAGFLMGVDLAGSSDVDWATLGLGTLLSAIVAWCSIHFFLKWIDKIGFMPFVVYRLVLGFVLLVIVV